MRELAPSPLGYGVHIGCGEGDYDHMLRPHAARLMACDINEGDVGFAAKANEALDVDYRVEDATRLSLGDGVADWVVAVDVIEHVADPVALIGEVSRVLTPGGFAILTAPNHAYPITYDPINLVLRRFGARMPLGAYGFGHQRLLGDQQLQTWFSDRALSIEGRERLSFGLVGAAECYWISAIQAAVKANRGNKTTSIDSTFTLRPGQDEPPLTPIVDWLIAADAGVFSWSSRSVGLGYVVRK